MKPEKMGNTVKKGNFSNSPFSLMPHVDVIFYLFLNKRVETRNLFDKFIKNDVNMDIRISIVRDAYIRMIDEYNYMCFL